MDKIEKLEHETLTDQADAILKKSIIKKEDKAMLKNIKREMIKMYSQYVIWSARAKKDYEQTKSDKYITIKASFRKTDNKRFTDKEAKEISEQEAEKEHGDYRVRQAIAQAMHAQIEHINWELIDYNVEQAEKRRNAEYGTEHTPQ